MNGDGEEEGQNDADEGEGKDTGLPAQVAAVDESMDADRSDEDEDAMVLDDGSDEEDDAGDDDDGESVDSDGL